MSKWRDQYKNAQTKPARGGADAADYDSHPILSEAMAGVRGTASGTWEIPPQSLTIWLEGPWVKFCLGAEKSTIKTFGSFQGFSKGFDGVEKALEEGHCETKDLGERKSR
jgi:hypothetical protein